MVMDTVAAAASQTYPELSYQVFVLDDGRSDSLRKAIEDLNKRATFVKSGRRPVVYLAREKVGDATHYKSGNIRFGLDRTLKQHGGSRYIAALDADMVPEPTWLERTMLSLADDPQVAMAGPPQHFCNAPTNDILRQDTGAFQQIYEPLRDRFGAN